MASPTNTHRIPPLICDGNPASNPGLVPHPRLGQAATFGADLHRTGLSWTRTCLDIGLVSLVMLRLAAAHQIFVVVNLCLGLLGVALLLALVARARTQHCQASGLPGGALLPAAVVHLSVGISLLGLVLVVKLSLQ